MIAHSFQMGQPFDPLEAQRAKIYPTDAIEADVNLSDGPKGS